MHKWETLMDVIRRQRDPLGVSLELEQLLGEGGRGALRGFAEDGARAAAERLGFGAAMLEKADYVAVDSSEAVRRLVEREGGMVLRLSEALRELPVVREKAWSLIDPRSDRYAAAVALAELEGVAEGYVVYVPHGVKIRTPIYACMLVTKKRQRQLLHNIIVLEEDAEATIVTGCAAAPAAVEALHVGVTEAWLGKGSRLNYAMVHSWSPGSHVRPRTAVHASRGAAYVSYYVLHGVIGSLHTEPGITLEEGARAHAASIIALDGGMAHAGTRVEIHGRNASAEIVSRIVARGTSSIDAPLRIVAHAAGRGHVECMAVPLSPDARISSSPILETTTDEAELSHEAAIGKLRGEEIEYLMARGLDEATARRLLLRGLLRVELPLPPAVKALVSAVERLLAEKAVA